MKRNALALFATIIALCLALTACGATKEDNTKAFAGVWELSGMVNDGQETTEEELDLIKSFGLNVFVVLGEDGSCTLNLFGAEMNGGTWEATSATAGSMKVQDGEQTIESSLAITEEGQLTLEMETDKLIFNKTTQEAMEEYLKNNKPGTSAQSESADEQEQDDSADADDSAEAEDAEETEGTEEADGAEEDGE